MSSLTSKVDVLTSDLKSNRVTRDGVITDLESVNQLAVRLNSEKVDLVNRINNQNKQVNLIRRQRTIKGECKWEGGHSIQMPYQDSSNEILSPLF